MPFILIKTMKNLKKKTYRENYLLKIGIPMFIGFTALGIILSALNITDVSSRGTKFNEVDNVFLLIISAVILAPLLEEFSFRGVFTENKYLKYVSYLGISIFIIILGSYFLIPLLVLFVLLVEFKTKNNFQKYSYFVNALLFSLIHYKFSDFLMFSAYPNILGTVGSALVLIWLVRNFGLWASMLLHFFINFSVISLGILGHENSDKTLRKVETNDFVMTYQYISLFENNGSTEFHKDKEVKAYNTSFSAVNKLLCPNSELEGIYFGKFNITIKRKENSTKKLDCQTFQELLNKSNISEE